jgi:hypothetical protein
MSGQRRESGGESGNAGEGKGTSRDAERAAEELGDPLPGLPQQYHGHAESENKNKPQNTDGLHSLPALALLPLLPSLFCNNNWAVFYY